MATKSKSVAALIGQCKADEGKLSAYRDLLANCQNDWETMAPIRKENERNERYKNGDQWSDYVTDPDNANRRIREDVLISRGGKTPLKNNFLQQYVRNVLGQALSNPSQPVVIARSEDDTNYSEMLTNTIQACLDLNESSTIGISVLEGFLANGYGVAKVRYAHWPTKNRTDGKIDLVDINRVFWNQDAEDPRWTDIRRIGEIHDYTLDELVANFAQNRADEKALRELYSNWHTETEQLRQTAADTLANMQFYFGTQVGKCRVYEVWERCSRWVTYAHDYLTGEESYYEDVDDATFDAINLARTEQVVQERMRIAQAPENSEVRGEQVEDAKLIYYKPIYESYWKVSFLTPEGYCIKEMETPYTHEEHPYVIGSMPKINGVVKPVFSDLVDMQRQINRLMTLLDFIIGTSAKGLLMVPEECLGNMSLDEFKHEYVKTNGVVLIAANASDKLPKQISTNATNVGAWEFLNFYLTQITQISGLSGAIQGQIASKGKSGVLYAQEAQNSQINFTLIFDCYNKFLNKMAEKLLKVLMQYYTTPRYVDINGKAYDETAKTYQPSAAEHIVDFNMVVTTTMDTPVFRQLQDDLLLQLLQAGQIPLDLFLDNSSLPFAKKLATQLKSMQDTQSQQMQGVSPEMIAQLQQEAQANANPQATAMLRKAVA
jgi:hypothetical protein